MFDFSVHGNWGSWTDVSGCSHSCGGGTKYSIRMCNHPSPSFGGSWCLGNATEFQSCNAKACPGILHVIPYYFKILFRSKLYNRLCAVVYLILEQISNEILTKSVICNYTGPNL